MHENKSRDCDRDREIKGHDDYANCRLFTAFRAHLGLFRRAAVRSRRNEDRAAPRFRAFALVFPSARRSRRLDGRLAAIGDLN